MVTMVLLKQVMPHGCFVMEKPAQGHLRRISQRQSRNSAVQRWHHRQLQGCCSTHVSFNIHASGAGVNLVWYGSDQGLFYVVSR